VAQPVGEANRRPVQPKFQSEGGWRWQFQFALCSGVVQLLIVGSYGLWKLGTGIAYLVRPQSDHKSIPDIDQPDILE
jgi:hypothetical protein